MSAYLKIYTKTKLKYQKIDQISSIKNLTNKALKIYLTKINQMHSNQKN